MSIVAIIPARGGSKRIPRKNIKDFFGKPIISYAITAAIESGLFDEVMVSTDDSEIAQIAKQYGASVPFFRSEEASNDKAPISDALCEVIENYSKNNKSFDYFLALFPASPFVTPDKLKQGIEKLIKTQADFLIPMVKFSHPPQRGYVDDGQYVKMIDPKLGNVRTQDLPDVYYDCGQFVAGKVSSLLSTRDVHYGKIVNVLVPESESQDIDNEEDWNLAEIKYRIMTSKLQKK